MNPPTAPTLHIDSSPPLQVGICLLDRLEQRDIDRVPQAWLSHNLADNTLTLHRNPVGGAYELPFRHSPYCPPRAFTQTHSNESCIEKNIATAACGIVESADGKLLMTRRSDHLTIFPRAWVFPGGHLDPHESLESSIIREISEEVGIRLAFNSYGQLHLHQTACTLLPFLLYESSFPAHIDDGLPRSQHLIIFYHITIPLPTEDISLTIDENEVDYAVWLSREDLDMIFRGVEGEVEGYGRRSRKVVNFLQLMGNAPNDVGEGMGQAHSLALAELLGSER